MLGTCWCCDGVGNPGEGAFGRASRDPCAYPVELGPDRPPALSIFQMMRLCSVYNADLGDKGRRRFRSAARREKVFNIDDEEAPFRSPQGRAGCEGPFSPTLCLTQGRCLSSARGQQRPMTSGVGRFKGGRDSEVR
jgi:hypothetical protein